MDTANVNRAFPDFALGRYVDKWDGKRKPIALSCGWRDDSYRHDVSPHWSLDMSGVRPDGGRTEIWIDYQYLDQREVRNGCRFLVVDVARAETVVDNMVALETNDWNEVLPWIWNDDGSDCGTDGYCCECAYMGAPTHDKL